MFHPPDGQPYCAAVDKRDKGHGDEGRKQKPDPKYMIVSIMRAKSQFD